MLPTLTPSSAGLSLPLWREKGNSMTDLLRKAFDAISALPPERQNAMAKMILAEIEDEER
jgi:hypothetical protein